MEEIGPSGGLPPLAALLRRVAIHEETELLGQDAADPNDLSLLADVALRSPTPPSPLNLPVVDALPVQDAVSTDFISDDFSFDDTSVDELNAVLQDGSLPALPDTLDSVWSPTTSPATAREFAPEVSSVVAVPDPPAPSSPVAVSTAEHGVDDVLRAVTVALTAMVASVAGAVPLSPEQGDAASLPGTQGTTPSSPASAPVSPHRNHHVAGDEERKEEPDPYDVDALLAAAAFVTEQPSFPAVPECHPSARWWNHFDANAPIDADRMYPIKKLLDRWGTPPHVAFLVEWNVKPCQLSWAWLENLKHISYLVEQVNRWKSSGSTDSFNQYYRRQYHGATASETGLCFLESFRAACYDLDEPDLVTSKHWTDLCTEYGKDLSNGVVRADIAAYFEFLRRNRVGLDYLLLETNALNESITDIALLGRYAQSYLDPDHYIVHAADDLVEHCFTLVVNKRAKGKLLKPQEVLDGYGDDDDPPPYYREPLKILAWLTKVIGIYEIQLKQMAKKKRPPKTKKRRAKRARDV